MAGAGRRRRRRRRGRGWRRGLHRSPPSLVKHPLGQTVVIVVANAALLLLLRSSCHLRRSLSHCPSLSLRLSLSLSLRLSLSFSLSLSRSLSISLSLSRSLSISLNFHCRLCVASCRLVVSSEINIGYRLRPRRRCRRLCFHLRPSCLLLLRHPLLI